MNTTKRYAVLQFLKQIKRCLLIVPCIILLELSQILSYLQPSTDRIIIPFSKNIWSAIFGQGSTGDLHTIMMSFGMMLSLFLFLLLFGNEVSQYFGGISPFYFTRVKNRFIWCVQQAKKLIIYASLYSLLILLTEGIIFLPSSEWDSQIMLLINSFILLTTLFFSACLLANLAAIRFGGLSGVSLVVVLLIFLDAMAFQLQDNRLNLLLNPLCFDQVLQNNMLLLTEKLAVMVLYIVEIVLVFFKYVCSYDFIPH